ncbi:MAG TPA: endo-1,3-alpha-glucanase family glycosylhydrolase, partial [Candidatus Nanoarchaeia archaeon]|nr:endo-1,3-alpha-glucanase family glycosylhydrolase [Candidatus Nanoarchaeia archaeon]
MIRKSLLFRTLYLLLASAAALGMAGCTRATYNIHEAVKAQRFQAPDGRAPKMLAVYQPWFGTKEHIDVGYSSQDPKVVQRQIDEAKALGINGFVVNWYGPRKEFMDKAYEVVQRAATKNNFKIAMQYDEAVDNPGNWTEAVIVDLQYAYDKYIAGNTGVPTDAYLRYNGRPVIFIFPKTDKTDWNRVKQVTQSWSDPPLLIYKDPSERFPNAFDGYYAWVQPGKRGWQHDGSNWGGEYLENFYQRMRTKYPNKIAVGAAWPGFDDTPASWSKNRKMDARCGKTFEESLRLFRRYYDDNQPLPFLLIVTWNDYEEGTAIERGLLKCNGDGSPRQTTK